MPHSPAIALTDFHVRVDQTTEVRPFHLADAEELYVLVHENYEHLYPWMGWVSDAGASREETRDFLRFSEKAAREQSQFNAAIVSNKRIIGGTGFPIIDWQNRLAHIGYWLDEAQTGKGYMTKAVRALTTYAFDALELNRIEIRCSTENAKSAAVAQRLGFKLEGTLRQSQLIHGRYVDDYIFAMLAADWDQASV